jgi:hypothetical protein
LALIHIQSNATQAASFSTSKFSPTSSLRFVNGFWFASLMLSLMSALGASLAKGWITKLSGNLAKTDRQHLQDLLILTIANWPIAGQNISSQFNTIINAADWHLEAFVNGLPLLTHLAFYLFSTGLVILIHQDDVMISNTILFMTAAAALFYLLCTLLPVFFSNSPFQTPLSSTLTIIWKKIHGQ